MTEAKKDIDITPEELDKIGKALKDEKFRTLFFDYCKEISNPENKAKYELEIQQLEKERGFDVRFLKPEAGHVIKAIDTKYNEKVFINVCTNAHVENAKVGSQKKSVGKRLVNGQNWRIPHILNPPRSDVDKAGKACRVCDVMFHPDVYLKATTHKEFMKMLNTIAVDSSEEKFNFKLDRNNLKYPKLKYKGRAEGTLLRNKDPSNSEAKVDEHLSKFVKFPEVTKTTNKDDDVKDSRIDGENGPESKESALGSKGNGKTVPRYKILHRGHFDIQDYTVGRSGVKSTRPAELCIEIELPAATSTNGADLDIVEKKLILDSEKPGYHLELNLPYPVDEDNGTAMFDKSRRTLIVTLPVVKYALDLDPESDKEAIRNENEGLQSVEDCSSQPPRSENEVMKDDTVSGSDLSSALSNRNEYSTDSISTDCNSPHVNESKDNDVHISDSATELSNNNHTLNGMQKETNSTSLPLNEKRFEDESQHLSGDYNSASEERKKSLKDHQVNGEAEKSCPVIGVRNHPECRDIENEKEPFSTFALNEQLPHDFKKCEASEFASIRRVNGCLSENASENVDNKDVFSEETAGIGCSGEESVTRSNHMVSFQAMRDQETEQTESPLGDPNEICSQNNSQVYHGKGGSEDCSEVDSKSIVDEMQERERSFLETQPTSTSHTEIATADDCGATKDISNECLMTAKLTFNDAQVNEKDEQSSKEDYMELINKPEDSNSIDDMAENELEMNFCLDGLADLSGMNQLPPLDYDQDEQTVTLNINLVDVKVEDISLGFSSRKVYFSMMSANQNGEPVRWCLLAKFLEYCRIDKDLCSVDIDKDRVVLTLPKSEASHGLWHRIYIGTSENSLKEMFFMTDHSMSELLGRLHQEENPWAKASVDLTPGEVEEESDALTRRLERLLREQDARFAEDASTSGDNKGESAKEDSGLSNVSEDTEVTDEKILPLSKEDRKKSFEETSSTSSDIAIDMTLDELQDDVIQDSSASTVSAEGLSRLPIERSNSDESAIGCNRKLRSILKRSQSESASGFYGRVGYKVGGDNSSRAFQKLSKTRIRSQSLNVDACSLPQERMGRFRNKSVSFDPEPQVCEFVEYSKKQLKKMRKQERKQTELAAKKVEAAAKKAAGKSKGLKGGKNMHFFNGFRRDSSKSDESDTDKDPPGEKPSGSAAMESTVNDVKQNVSKSDSVKKSSRKSKTKKNGERKDERTLAKENRTNSSDQHLTNSLIYELDD